MSNEQQYKDKKHWSSIASLWLGIASIFLWEFSIVPILAIIFGTIGLIRDKKRWMAGIGLALGIIFLVIRINHGFIDRGFFSTSSKNNDTTQTSIVPPTKLPDFSGNTSKNKSLKVSDGTTSFSFEVPEKWLTETRHSGEKQLTVEEMRQFLADNCDRNIYSICSVLSNLVMVKKMSPDEVKKRYFRTDLPYPSASVSAGDHITYSDMYGLQIDFNIEKNFDYYTYSNGIKKNKKLNWSIEKVGGLNADVITAPMDRDENGNEISTKMGSGGKMYYIRINNGKDMLVINKEAKRDNQFETDFRNIIQTLQFENEK